MEKIIEFKKVKKEFLGGKIIANDNVSFSIEKKSIHALAGENGAGKSTLLSMLFGLYKPTSGEIIVNDKIAKFTSAADAMKNGIGMVQQHFQLIDKYSVFQNIVLGIETAQFGFIKKSESIKKIELLIKKYKFNISPKNKISKLSVGQQQKVEILKVLYRNPEIIVFDEPTAMLTPSEIEELIGIIKKLKKEGKTIIIVTHKLDEIKAVADKVSVLRKGRYIDTLPISKITPQKLSKLMVGKDITAPKLDKIKKGKKILDVKDLKVIKNHIKKIKNLSFELYEGEILAIAGVEGNGQVELANSISGIDKKYIGKILYKDNDIKNLPIKKRNSFISHIPEDRHKHGMILDMLAFENASIKKIDEFTKFGIIRKRKMKNYGKDVIKLYDVRGTDEGDAISRGLSGGNQQKLVVGREIMNNTDILIVFQATRGLDVGAINYIHNQIIKARKNKKAILLISYDLNEIINLADRVIVLNSGLATGEVSGKNINKKKIGELMSKGGGSK